jgi:GMP synthase-like glutamine amidotransferase
VHVLQHVPYEGTGSIQPWMEARGIPVTTARLFEGSALPGPGDFDWLIVMGGPMSVNDEKAHSWLAPEKRLISRAIEAGRIVLGICLGAQLIASALGARVFPNACKEIGWFPVRKTPGADSDFAGVFNESQEVFHWHGDTFDLPFGAMNLLESSACAHQAYSIGNRVVGLQFHLETTRATAASLIDNSRHEIVPSATIQNEEEMLSRPERFNRINGLMDSILESLHTGVVWMHQDVET